MRHQNETSQFPKSNVAATRDVQIEGTYFVIGKCGRGMLAKEVGQKFALL